MVKPIHLKGGVRVVNLRTGHRHTLIAMSSAGLLTDLGHNVVEAPSGAQALNLRDGHEFDLMVTD